MEIETSDIKPVKDLLLHTEAVATHPNHFYKR
jgi:hypothetical protein